MSARRVFGATLLVFALPLAVEWAMMGLRWPFALFANDTFYYLTVARNIVERGVVSFDGRFPTNGFHPLWQMVLAGLWAVARVFGLSEPHFLVVTVLANAAFVAVMLWLLARALTDSDGRLPSLFALLPVGVYAVLMMPMWIFGSRFQMTRGNIDENDPPLYGTLWSYVDGMESSLALLLFGVAVWLFVRKKRLVWLALALSGMTLARLDHGMIAASILAGALVAARQKWREALWACLAFALPIFAYLLINHSYVHMLLPVSGRVKTSFPHINHANLMRAWTTVLHPMAQGWWRLYRQAQAFIPAVFALVPLIGWRKRLETQFDRLLLYASPGVLLLSLYNFLYVDMWSQGHWYFPVSTLFVSLVLLRPLERLQRWPRGTLVAALTLGVFCFWTLQHRPSYHQRIADVYFIDAPKLRQLYKEPPRLFEYDDGIIAFSTGFATLVWTGFVLDREAFEAQRRGRLVPLALSRGHDRFASVNYLLAGKLDVNSSSDEIRDHLKIPQISPSASYTVEYRRGDFLVVHIAQ